MAAQEAQQPQNMEQLEKQTKDESLKKVINEIKELSDDNDKKENDKVELDAILTNEFANTLKANDAKILLEELNKYQIPEGGTAPEGYDDLKNFLEMKANDHPIKENSITGIDNKTTVENISENQKNLINTTISTYFTEKNGDKDNGNYINIDKIHGDLKDIKDTLTNIKTILEHPTKENIQKLQQFIYNNLDGDLKNKYLDENKDKKIKSNPDKDRNIIWDGSYGKSTNENLNAFLSNTKDYIKDYQEGKDVADKHTQKANEIEQQKIEEQKNRVSKENAEINADNINVTLRGKWKEMNESRLQAEKQQISDKLNSYVQLREYLPKNVQEILCKTRAALESTSQVNDKGDPVSEEVFALENKLNELGFMPKEANDGNNGVDGKFGDKTYDAVINCLESSLKNSAEIDPGKVTVKLRGIYKNLNGDGLKNHIKATADELNCFREKRDILTYDQKKVLILTKAALESTSNSEDKSEAVLTLENELNSLGFMPKEANDGNNGVDGKFGDKTYNAILACLDGEKPQFLKGPEKTAVKSTEKVQDEKQEEKNEKVEKNTNTISIKGAIEAFLKDGWGGLASYFLGGKTNTDKYENNKNIDRNNEAVNSLLKSINIAKINKDTINGFEQINRVLENGKEDQIRELQLALWTPTNNLMITGKIDEQTAIILEEYIKNKNNIKNPPLENVEDCALSGYTKKPDISADESTGWAGGTTYEMTGGFGDKSYMYKGYKEGNKYFIASNLECTADNKVKIGANTIIQYLDGTKEVYTNGILVQYDSAGNKIENQDKAGSGGGNAQVDETQPTTAKVDNKDGTQPTTAKVDNKDGTQPTTVKVDNKDGTQTPAASVDNKDGTQPTTVKVDNKDGTQTPAANVDNKDGTQTPAT